MTKKYSWDEISKSMISAMGGKENLVSFQNCATRFRFYVKDNKKVNKVKLKEVKLAKGVHREGNQWQVIFGAGIVNKVYDNFNTHISLDANSVKAKQPLWNNSVSFWSNFFSLFRRAIRSFADIFIPLIPIFIAGGLSLALVSLIKQTSEAQSAVAAAKWFELIGGGILGSLPAFVGYTAMKKFGGTPMLGLAIGIIMVAPSLLNGWVSSSNYVFHGFGAKDAEIINLKNQYVLDNFNSIKQLFIGDYKDLAASKKMISQLFTEDTFTHLQIQEKLDGISSIGELKSAITAGSLNGIVTFPTTLLSMDSVITVQNFIKDSGNNYVQLADRTIGLNEFANLNQITINATPALFPNAPSFFSFSFVGYQAQVFPTLGIIAVAYWIERLLRKISHESFAIILVPLGTVVLSLFIGFAFVGPIGRYIGWGIAEAFQNIYKYTNWPFFGLGGALLGASYPFLVVTGLHQGFVPIEASLIASTISTYGHSFTWITAISSVSNVAQGMVGVTLGVMIWKKAPKAASTAFSGSVSANLGITEPILFGVNLPTKFGLLAASLASAIGGYYVGMTHTVANSMGSASWLGLVQFDISKTTVFDQYIKDYGFHTSNGLSDLAPIVNEVIALSITSIAAIGFTCLFAKTFGKNSYNQFINENKTIMAKAI